MTLVIPNNYGIATYTWQYNPLAKQVSTTCAFQDQAGNTPPNTVATQLRNIITGVNGCSKPADMTLDWQLLSVKTLQRDSAGNLLAGADLTAVAGTGTPASSLSPLFTSFVITKRTVFAGKKFRGRMYFPGFKMTDTQVDVAGAILPAFITTNQALFTSWFNSMTVAGYPAALLHDNTTPGSSQPQICTGFALRPIVGIQRRRRNPGA